MTIAPVSGPLRVGLVGLGHWGPNLFRNFLDHERCEVVGVCDRDPSKLAKVARHNVPTYTDAAELMQSSAEAIVIATPVTTHEALATMALESGKHVFVEKPLAASAAACERLIALAAAQQRRLMVGHVFVYNPAVLYVKQLIESGALGKVLFIYGRRTNFGPIRTDVNAFWDLASHDISIVDYWLDSSPVDISASGSCMLDPHVADVVNATLHYPGGVACYLLSSWLHPKKVRQITIVGEQKMAIWDDIGDPVRIYDKSVRQPAPVEQVDGTMAEFNFSISEGDLLVPRVPRAQPLKVECDHFVDCLLSGQRPRSAGEEGLSVVRVLEAANRSMRQDNARIDIDS